MTDTITKTSILYLAALSANRAKTLPICTERLNFEVSTVNQVLVADILDNNGRFPTLRRKQVVNEHETIPTISKNSSIADKQGSDKDIVSELLELEAKLSSLGLMKSSELNIPSSLISHPAKINTSKPVIDNYSRYLSSALGDSFLVLSTYKSKVCQLMYSCIFSDM